MGVSNFGLKIDRKQFYGRVCACIRKLAKIPEIVVQFSKFLVIQEIWHEGLKYQVKFYTGNSFMAVSAHAHRKWPKWFKTRPYWQKFRSSTKPGRDNFIMDSIFYQNVQLWPFLRIHNSKLGKKSRSENMVHLQQVHIKENSHVQLCYKVAV